LARRAASSRRSCQTSAKNFPDAASPLYASQVTTPPDPTRTVVTRLELTNYRTSMLLGAEIAQSL
jgi:hypothetical protein